MRGIRYPVPSLAPTSSAPAFEHGKNAVPASLICFATATAPDFEHEAVGFTAAKLPLPAVRLLRQLQPEQGMERN